MFGNVIMKKDIFNGKILIQHRSYVKFTLFFASLVMFLISIFSFVMGLFYQNMDKASRVFCFCFASFYLLFAVFYPLLSIALIRIYPRKRKLTHFFLKEFVFKTHDPFIDKKA